MLARTYDIAMIALLIATALVAPAGAGSDSAYGGNADKNNSHQKSDASVELGPRPFYLIDGMDAGRLKDKLQSCKNGPFYRTDFSIGHRGSALQFPEHTRESYQSSVRQGAGIVECDTTFTKDGALVCRHSECDLHTTTNIVDTPLNAMCTTPWNGPGSMPKCCTSDITLEQFKTLTGKMDSSNPAATTAAGYLGGTASWRTDLYTGRGTLMTLKESIELNETMGVKHTPELKESDSPRVKEIFGSQEAYAQKIIDTLVAERVNPKNVWLQSFNLVDVLYWIKHAPAFGEQAVYLDDIDPTLTPAIPRLTVAELQDLKKKGVRIFAPPMWALLSVDSKGNVVPSQYARDIKNAGLDIITWTFERADLRKGAANAGWYYQFDPNGEAIKKDSDMYKALDVLARRVGILGIFSDWPATVTYYANCMGLS
jgi:glycerophosphoryl diester phosphodiesterase